MDNSIFEVGVDHACLTGDCRHELQDECDAELGRYIGELCEAGRKLAKESMKTRHDGDMTKRMLDLEKRVEALERLFFVSQGDRPKVYQDRHGRIIRYGDIVLVNSLDDGWYNLVIERDGSLILATEARSTFRPATELRLADVVHGSDNPVEVVANLWLDTIRIEKDDGD